VKDFIKFIINVYKIKILDLERTCSCARNVNLFDLTRKEKKIKSKYKPSEQNVTEY